MERVREGALDGQKRWALGMLAGGAVLVACNGGRTLTDPGAETGPCIEGECAGGLMCLSDVCVDPGGESDDSVDVPGGPTSDTEGPSETTTDGGHGSVRGVDILMVLDDSGSMGTKQAKLARAFGSLVNPIEAAGLDWRLGFTTTDNGHIWCAGTNPAGGKLVSSTCRSREQDFVFMGAQTVNVKAEACFDICPEDLSNIALEPTTTHLDSTSRPRPWIESIAGVTNLPAGVSALQALQCIGPQGIAGCGFEQPLESMYKALVRSETASEEQYGFLRPDAHLVVVIVSDEVDCSHSSPDHDSIFHPDGDRTFWSDPDAQWPNSAVCWHGAVECIGSGAPYAECNAVHLDPLGNPTSPDNAVFRPVSRYVELLEGIQSQKQAVNPGLRVIVTGLLGVNSDGSVTYADSVTHDQFQIEHGMGPGCASNDGLAVPPVRMRELAEAFQPQGRQSLFSICDGDFGPALGGVAEAILSHTEG